MKAIVQSRYGDETTLSIAEVPKPTIGPNDILVKVEVGNIASGDMRLNTFDVPLFLAPIFWLLFGFKGPRQQVRGVSGAGIVDSIGAKVTKYAPGDKIYFINSMKAGVLAEYVSLKESAVIAPVPENCSMEDAAPLGFGALSAFHFINNETIKKGQSVLIYGASGSLGTYAVQFAKYYGATVTAVSSAKNHKLLLEIGADHVIDYTTTDFTTQPKKYDVIFDAVGKLNKKVAKSVLQPGGAFLSSKQLTKEDIGRLLQINKIIVDGGLKTVLDKVFPFEEFKDAHKLVYSKHKVGNVVLKINP